MTFPSFEGFQKIARYSRGGSLASPGFMLPEGIVIYHKASKTLFKKTLKNDESPKGVV